MYPPAAAPVCVGVADQADELLKGLVGTPANSPAESSFEWSCVFGDLAADCFEDFSCDTRHLGFDPIGNRDIQAAPGLVCRRTYKRIYNKFFG